MFYFFFSSRRRHTRCYRDWSSDVCSSDLSPAVGEVVRMRAAALAGDGVDGLDAVRSHAVKAPGGERDDLAFLYAGLERLGDVLIHTVDHRRGHVEQRQLVDVLDLPRREQRLLPVA